MPFRFRKSVKVAPGVRLNFSKRGVSASAGAGGLSYTTRKVGGGGSSSKKAQSGGFFSCIFFPFVLLFQLLKLFWNVLAWVFKKLTATPQTRRLTLIGIGGATFLGAALVAISAFLQAIGVIPTPTPPPTQDLLAVQSTAQAAAILILTQTAAAIPIEVVSTNTLEPTAIIPTSTLEPTSTPPPTATNTLVVVIIPPTAAPPVSTGFDNNGDGRVTCGDFNTQFQAQQAYNAGYTNLDGNDNDGRACESLP